MQLVHEALVEVAISLPIQPTEIWTVALSGTLTRGLQADFPDANVFAVQGGHKLSEEEAGRAKVFVSPYKYDEPVKLVMLRCIRVSRTMMRRYGYSLGRTAQRVL
jgi:hypothetical protein